MGIDNPDIAKRVEVDKIDRRQGSEWDIVICDITRTKGTGFLHFLGRLNTFFSRAKDGLYIIGNKPYIDKLDRSNGKWLQYFQREYLKFIVLGEIPSECKWYKAGQVDLRSAYDFEDTGARNTAENNAWGNDTAGDEAGGNNPAENDTWGGNAAGGDAGDNNAGGCNTAED